MRKYFRIILCLLIFGIAIVQMPFGNTITQAKSVEDYDGVLVQLGIMDSESAKSDEVVTRAEFSIWLSDILTWNGLSHTSPATKQIFSDVPQWDWLAENLEYLHDFGIIRGYGDSTFRPDESMQLSSAYSMILNVLGYQPLISVKGDFPKSVMETAKIAEIDEELDGYAHDTELTGKMAAVLLDNMLNASVMEPKSLGAGIEHKTGNIFINDYMKIYEYEGIITGAEGVSVLGNAIRKGELEIDGVTYSNKVKNTMDLLGCEVKYYVYMKNGFTEDIWAVIPDRNNTVLEIDSREALELKDREFKYEYSGKEKSVEISSVADIIINGVPKTEEEASLPSYGTIRLVDNDGDRRYDLVEILDYETIVVGTVDLSRKVIYGQNANSLGKAYVVEVDEYEYIAFLDSNGEMMELENIKPGSLLTGMMNENSLILHYYENVVSGDVKQINYDYNGMMDIVIDQTTYFVINDVFLKNGVIRAGAKGDFLIDFKGNIAAAVVNNNGTYNFGYLFKSGISDNPFGEVEVKLLTENGDVVKLNCTDTFRVDGIKYTENEAVRVINSSAPCLIRYLMKEDKIAAIDMPMVQPMADFTSSSSSISDSLLQRSYAPMQYKPSVSTFKQRGQGQRDTVNSISNIPYESIVNGEALITANTIIFTVPNDTTNARDADYGVKKKSELAADEQCDVAGYNTSGEMLVSEAVVLYEEDSVIKVAAKLFIVDKEFVALNADNEVTYGLEGFYNGTKIKRTLENSNLITIGGHRLKTGDIIRTRQDEKGTTNNIELIYSSDGTAGHLSNVNQWKPDNVDAIGFDSPMRCIRGTVVKKDNSVIVLNYGSKTELFDISNTMIYVMDEDGSEREKTYIGTLGDIEEGIEILASTRSSSMTELIVLK